MTRERDRIQENANSYIVRNCPCIKHYDDIELDNRCMSDQGIPFFCENNSNCVVKRVIEKCTNAINTTFNNECFELATEVTNLFDIEEINK